MDKTIKSIRSNLSTYRQAVMVMFLAMGASFLTSFLRFDNLEILGMRIASYEAPQIIFIGGFLLAVASFLNRYLDDGGKKIEIESIKHVSSSDDSRYVDIERRQKNTEAEFKENIRILSKQINEITARISSNSSEALDPEEKENLVHALLDKVKSDSSKELINEIRESVKSISDQTVSDRIEGHFSRTMTRLLQEIRELSRRAKVNLVIGSVAALSGVSIFILFVFESSSSSTMEVYLASEFAPRISLVIVIEIFAYFFLGLYKSNLSEIKYFHNELTNTEMKYLAFEEALASSDKETVSKLLYDISKTERNFLLKKGESTVSIEERKANSEEQKSLIQSFMSGIQSQKK